MTGIGQTCNAAEVTATRRLLSAAQVAEKLQVSPRTVRRMAIDGRLPYVDQHAGNGAYLFDPAVIEIIARQAERTSA